MVLSASTKAFISWMLGILYMSLKIKELFLRCLCVSSLKIKERVGGKSDSSLKIKEQFFENQSWSVIL